VAFDPEEPARHLRAAAPLILARKDWTPSPDDRIEIVELASGWRVDVLGCENGKPLRRVTNREPTLQAAMTLANDFAHVTGFAIKPVIRRAQRAHR
jgi:hypothetical protein